MSPPYVSPRPASGRPVLNIGLWASQTLVFIAFAGIGAMKLFLPVDRLAALWIWPGQVPEPFLRTMGLIDLAGGVGILLPMLTGVRPRLVVAAALGCTLLQLAAIVFHVSRGEANVTPFNLVLLVLSSFVLWGRGARR
ncbi:DoxX family protein [Sphingomonas sp. Leaf21]|uniref:DoxX family protein n=1 Tax=Sphingomonas sp. Leaf21 TaxID=2876550 RepID=UPI0022A89449|nr:DoxX family protein [Sphingomonas sp. Leaf21]